VAVDADALAALHPAIASRVAREVLGRLGGNRFIGFDHVKALLDFAASAAVGAALSLPGQQARMASSRFGGASGRVLELGPEPGRGGDQRTSFRVPLSIPGEVVLAPQRLAVSADWSQSVVESPDGCLVGGVKLPLAVRSRQPGDKFRPPGLGGRSKKLQDYLVDRKVPRAERDLLPLVVDDDNRIVWVVGHGVAEGFRVPAPSHGVISLKARRLGGEG
jgi:tRNA(Ile)-lysidine synthase